MKRCSKCQTKKKLKEFSSCCANKDGFQYYCKACNKKYMEPYVKKNKKHFSRLAKKKHKEVYAKIAGLKNKPCIDCRKRFPPCVMDFDHVRGKKKFQLSQSISKAWSNIMKEISKCDLVCANCHRIRTHARRRKNVR